MPKLAVTLLRNTHAARGFRTAANFIAIAYLRLGKLTHLPASPFVPAVPSSAGVTQHRV